MKKFYEEPTMECVVIYDVTMDQIPGVSDGSDEEF